MVWWGWLVLGLALMASEILTPGVFFLLFLGIGGLIVGGLVGAGLAIPIWLQWVLFAVISFGSIVYFRTKLQSLFPPEGRVDRDGLVGESAVCKEAIMPGAMGRLEMRGTEWNGKNIGSAAIEAGTACTVVEINGLTLHVRGESK